MALEAIALREPLDPVSGLLSRPLRDILGDFRLRPDRLIPRPDSDPPVLTDQEFLEEALRRAHLADIVKAIMEARGRFWPCRPATYSPLRAVPGAEITIATDDGDWPDTPAEVRFPTASGGTVGAAAVRSGDPFGAVVPDTAVSGEAVVYFDPEGGAADEVPSRARASRRPRPARQALLLRLFRWTLGLPRSDHQPAWRPALLGAARSRRDSMGVLEPRGDRSIRGR